MQQYVVSSISMKKLFLKCDFIYCSVGSLESWNLWAGWQGCLKQCIASPSHLSQKKRKKKKRKANNLPNWTCLGTLCNRREWTWITCNLSWSENNIIQCCAVPYYTVSFTSYLCISTLGWLPDKYVSTCALLTCLMSPRNSIIFFLAALLLSTR